MEFGRSIETAWRSELAPAYADHYGRSHSRCFWGRGPAPAGRAGWRSTRAILASADQKERDVGLRLFPIGVRGGDTIVCDKRLAGAEFACIVAERHGALIRRPKRKTEPSRGPHLAPIRQCIESIFWTLKDRLGLERHNARTLHGLRARITAKLLALAASVWLNH